MACSEVNTNKVYVVTCAELGWDCVVGVFDVNKVTLTELQKCFKPEHHYYIDHRIVETSIEEFQ